MNGLFRFFMHKEIIEKIKVALKNDTPIEITDTMDDVNIVLIKLIAQITQSNVLIVNNNLFHAQKLYEKLKNHDVDTQFYPQDEFITTEMLAMSEALKLERLATIKSLMINQSPKIVVTHPTGFIKHLLPKETFKEAILNFKTGSTLDINQLIEVLIRYGYTRSTTVEKEGQFAKRGSIIDLFTTDSEQPLRIDFFDDTIDTIRTFDINTQRSLMKQESFTLFPRVEFLYNDQMLHKIKKNIEHKFAHETYSLETMNRVKEELLTLNAYHDQDRLSRYQSFTGLPLETISDYMDNPVIIYMNHQSVMKSTQSIIDDLADWTVELGDYPKLGFSFIRDPNRIYHHRKISINPLNPYKGKHPLFPLKAIDTPKYIGNMHLLSKDLIKWENHTTVVITLRDEKRLKHFTEAFEEKVNLKILGKNDTPFENKINLVISENHLTFEWFDVNTILLSDASIFEEPPKRTIKYQSVFKDTKKVSTVKDLKKGDYLVHYENGIGRFTGIETIHISGYTNDYIVIQYRGDDTLYIPVENIHLIQKYEASEGIFPKLNRLGSAEWEKTKQRVRKKVRNIADYLIKLYAARELAVGFAYSQDNELMAEFEADFEYEETIDQAKAIEAVKQDMEKPKPMDRLICGDVGYGKTEIALRAAIKAALDNKQTAYLAPTTVLSRQHYYTFKNRLEKHGVRVALLNRFVLPSKQKQVIKGLKEGTIDIVLGTHRLLSADIEYKNLGLLIIDEEQRFGVEHKEKIKSMKVALDVLSLSATPIPRTMQMALTGVKEMSLLETPPKNRLPVQTYVLPRNDHVIKDAIERELARNGQVFYLYNRVETIDHIQVQLSRLIPDARIAYAHGKMSRMKLENVIESFLDHKFDVLVSTTIIETGIDIPNANTLIIHDADQLGLAQLYQIRGRVGRSDRIAYSYLMYQKDKQLTEDATKRLQVIKEFTELGSGYKIAVRDLGIRGAGDLLGTEQSGFIDSVGMQLFLEILKEEIDKEKGHIIPDKTQIEKAKQSIRFEIDKTIPIEYIAEEDLRIELHRRINDLASINELILLKEELSDRFGKLPKGLELYLFEKLYEHLAVIHDLEKVFDLETQIQFVFSAKKSQQINGERLFSKISELSPHIYLSYKKEKIYISIDKYKLNSHFLPVIVDILETL